MERLRGGFQAGSGGPGPEGQLDPDHQEIPAAYYVGLLDAQGNFGRALAQPGYTTSAPALPKVTVAQANARHQQPFTVSGQHGGPWRVIVAPLSDGSGSIAVATSLDDVRNTVNRLTVLEVIIGAVALVLLGAIGYFVVRNSLRPLVEVELTAAAIAAGDLTRRVPDLSPRTEVGRLSGALNSMLGQIESAFRAQEASESAARQSEERMRRFVADASHELRTPLTSIRGFAELYRQGAVADAAAIKRAMRRIEDEAARMGILVEDLLLLARMDEQRPLDQLPVDVLTIATDAVQDARASAPDHPVDIEVLPSSAAPIIVGDDARLPQGRQQPGDKRCHTHTARHRRDRARWYDG